jgi:hypothetical protein
MLARIVEILLRINFDVTAGGINVSESLAAIDHFLEK